MYSREVDGKTLTFGHEGVLYKNSFVMYDKESNSLWIHTTGQSIKGKMKGKELEFIPSTVVSWKEWKERYPETKVLTGKKARGMMGTFNLKKNLNRYGLSVGQGDTTKLYRYEKLKEEPVVNDEFDGEKIVVMYDSENAVARAYVRGKRTFKIKNGKFVDDSGKEWSMLTGTSGKERLAPVPATAWLIERWRAFYPKGKEYENDF